VVLLDEIEKAHPRILDVFLQVFDNGRLTDGRGRSVDFRNTLIILTSNLRPGSKKAAPVGFRAANEKPEPTLKEGSRSFLMPHFRTELINRLSDVIEFKPLGTSQLRAIVDKLVADAAPRLAQQNIKLRFSDAAYDAVIQKGYDERFGARELRRAFERLVIQPLADRLLEGSVQPGTVLLDVDAEGAFVMGSAAPTK
jgi:ATP-dependent Clp protease ATP-binding subunit ClpB